ncbi:unnamed protein product [Rotaria sordida]|uniref:NAD(P)(+)--arginine ADP-ribosyltransferase n=3 Tax=Rotaria sordida TaxID=392033 RepID=A0A814UEN5_9BILA|nr:unnamed protein product [Rotaria sordida]
MIRQNPVSTESINNLLSVLNSFNLPVSLDTNVKETIVTIVNTLNSYPGSLLCAATILSHNVFSKLFVYYRLLLKEGRQLIHISNDTNQLKSLSELNTFLCQLSIGITNTNIHMFKNFFLKKSFIDELCDCLNDIKNGHIENSFFMSIVDSMIAAFHRLHDKDIDNIVYNPIHEQLINSIVQYITSIHFNEDIASASITSEQRMILKNCLHYIANLKTSYGHHWQTIISRSQLQSFVQWFEKTSQLSVDWWTPYKITIIDYFITIFSIRLNDLNINEEELNLYMTLLNQFASILLLSKDSQNYHLIDIIIKHLFIFSNYEFSSQSNAFQIIISFLHELTSDVSLYSEQDDNAVFYACCLLIKFNSYDEDDIENLVFILMNSLLKTLNRNQSIQVNRILCYLKSLLLRYEFQTKQELNNSQSLSLLRQCATNFESFDATIRQIAIDIFYSIMVIPKQETYTSIDSLTRQIIMPDVPIEQVVIYDWSLDNWKKTDDVKTVLIPIILQDYEEKKLSSTKKQIQERIIKLNRQHIAERNREDVTIVWVYDGKTMKSNDLLRIRRQLNLIRYHIKYFDSIKSLNAALNFILCRQSEYIVVLIDFVALYSIIDQLFHSPHLLLSVYVYNSTKEIPMVSFVSSDIQSCITSFVADIEFTTIYNVEFAFYETKQTQSACDLTNSSSHFLWLLFLGEVLPTIPAGNHYDFVSAARCWYSKNVGALNEIDYFEMMYNNQAPDIWYNSKKSTLIQRILQNAFKQGNMDIIYVARSIIIDLMRKITFSYTSNERCCVFVGTIISKKRVAFLYKHQDVLLTPIGFLIGHTNRDKIITHLQKQKQSSQNLLGKVLFEINTINIPILNLSDENILFNIGVVFRILNVEFDSILDIYHIHLETITNDDLTEQFMETYIYLKSQVGEYINRNILFGLLLVDMNCIRSAMNYFLYYDYHASDNREIEIHKLATLGRIALRCNKLLDAEKFLLNACDLHKRSQISIEDSFIGRIRLDLVLVLIQQNRQNEATDLCRETLSILCDSPQNLSITLLNLAQSISSLCNIELELANTSFTQIIQEYEIKNYLCQHPVLIGGCAIEIGDKYRAKDLIDMALKSYLFSCSISDRNQPMNHPMILASLHRLSELLNLTSVAEKLEARLTLMYQEILSDDANDKSNKIIADIGRRLALHFIKINDHSQANRWFEMCLSIYRKQWPLQEQLIHQCQAYCFKNVFGSQMQIQVKTSTEHDSLQLNDIVRSVSYMRLITKSLLREKIDEENHRWDEAMAKWKHNCEVNSGVVVRKLIVWIDPDLQQKKDDNATYTRLCTCEHVDFHSFEDVDSAVFYLMRNYEFTHAQIILANTIADEFFDMQEIARLQTVVCLTMCIFIYDADEQEEIDRYNHYLTYLPCRRKCRSEERYHYEQCLIMSKDEYLLQEFALQTDILGSTIAHIIWLVDIEAFGNMFSGTVDQEKHDIILTDDISDHDHIEFIGYISGYGISIPKVLHHLRFPEPIHMSKADVQMAALVIFGRRHNLTDQQITILCRYFGTGNCIRSTTFIKYLVRLWSLESPISFYRLVNTALAECSLNDIHCLRYIIYDYFEMFYAKLLPYFSGILYRGISMSEENIAILMSLEGQKIYFVCFTATSKNRARAQVGGNVLFEIQTLSAEGQEAQKLHSNADISIVSQFPEEEEVLYAPLATFRLISIVHDDNEYDMEHYTVKLQELGGSSFLSILHLDKIKRMPNASPFLIGTDHWQIPVSEGKRLFSLFLDIYSPDFFYLNILKSDR